MTDSQRQAAQLWNAYKNQHYLSQFYLKGFVPPEAGGQLFVMRRGHQF